MYATLDQMQNMEFGVTGMIKIIDGEMFELLTGNNGLYGWAHRYNDAEGNMIDWDRVPEAEAKKLGLEK